MLQNIATNVCSQFFNFFYSFFATVWLERTRQKKLYPASSTIEPSQGKEWKNAILILYIIYKYIYITFVMHLFYLSYFIFHCS